MCSTLWFCADIILSCLLSTLLPFVAQREPRAAKDALSYREKRGKGRDKSAACALPFRPILLILQFPFSPFILAPHIDTLQFIECVAGQQSQHNTHTEMNIQVSGSIY